MGSFVETQAGCASAAVQLWEAALTVEDMVPLHSIWLIRASASMALPASTFLAYVSLHHTQRACAHVYKVWCRGDHIQANGHGPHFHACMPMIAARHARMAAC